MSVAEVIAEVMKDASFYKNSGGGMTLSGGEPLYQYDFSLGLLEKAKENGLHTAVETSGYCKKDILSFADLSICGCLT
jgi:pyruvate formate lyase activating enzyme